MNFFPPLYVLIFAVMYELYVPFAAADSDEDFDLDDISTTQTTGTPTENITETLPTTTTTPRSHRSRFTRERYTFDGVDYHEYLGKFHKSEDLDCSLRYLKCYLYTPLHWEACVFDEYNNEFRDVYSACQIDFMNCWDMRHVKRDHIAYYFNYKSFEGYGHKCRISRGKLEQGPP